GADAVKFQTFKAERIASADAPKAEYQMRSTGTDESQLDMLRRLELSKEEHRELVSYCSEKGITFLSSPFDEESADFLETLGVPAFKIPSGEITNLPFLAHVARKRRPMIVSTGMATLGEVEAAVSTIRDNGNPHIVLLHCVSNYPADPKDVNLRAMETMRVAFGIPVGYSDHTEGDEIALAAVALGACVLEKHFTLDRSLPGPDHQASIEPVELANLVRRVRSVEAALGHGQKVPANSEANTAAVARKSLVAAKAIEPGTVLAATMVQARRPGTGIPPAHLRELLGRVATVRIPANTMLRWEMFR
ncbi:N-acetylneuraminate synthase, partial [Candidatus Bipolaricaulota bacterium]|nr:N-acetylneuraminate synthase [Candidatus Bipolaricaulota bacterium]